MSFLERMQSKPQRVKAQYAFVGACVITGLIGIVWMSTIPARFEELKPSGIVQESESDAPAIGEVLSDTKNQLGNIINWNGDTEPETGTDIEQQIPDDSALGSLETEIELQPETDTPTPPQAFNIPESESTTEVVPEEKVSFPVPSPRVILIATSTNQKSE